MWSYCWECNVSKITSKFLLPFFFFLMFTTLLPDPVSSLPILQTPTPLKAHFSRKANIHSMFFPDVPVSQIYGEPCLVALPRRLKDTNKSVFTSLLWDHGQTTVERPSQSPSVGLPELELVEMVFNLQGPATNKVLVPAWKSEVCCLFLRWKQEDGNKMGSETWAGSLFWLWIIFLSASLV